MSIEFHCSHCGRLLRTPDETAGRQAKCPACGSIQPIPTPGTAGEPETTSTQQPAGGLPQRTPGEEIRSPFGETLPYRGEGEPVDQVGGSPFASAPPPPPPSGAADSENPYQAPAEFAAEIRPAYQPGAAAIQPTRINIGDVLSRAWAIFKAQWVMCTLVFFTSWVLSIGTSLAATGITEALRAAAADQLLVVIVDTGTTLASQVFSAWLGLGLVIFMIRVARGQPAQFLDLFSGGSYLLTMIVASILFVIALLLIWAVCFIPTGIVALVLGVNPATFVIMFVSGAFALVGSIYIGLTLSQFVYAIVDRNAGIVDCLLISREITRDNKLMIFVLYLVGIPLVFIGILACCVGYFPAMAYLSVALSVQYLLMTGQPTGDQLWQSSAAP